MNIRFNPVMSCVIALLVIAATACSANGQVPNTVTSTQFFSGKVNGYTDLQSFVTNGGDWDQLKVTMGQPISEACDTTFVSTDCTVEWDGVSAFFSNVAGGMKLLTLTFNGSAAFLDYGGTTIRVGDPIGQLQQIFPEAYQGRGNNCVAPPCAYAAVVNSGDTDGIMFKYNPSTLAIEEIEWLRHIL